MEDQAWPIVSIGTPPWLLCSNCYGTMFKDSVEWNRMMTSLMVLLSCHPQTKRPPFTRDHPNFDRVVSISSLISIRSLITFQGKTTSLYRPLYVEVYNMITAYKSNLTNIPNYTGFINVYLFIYLFNALQCKHWWSTGNLYQ